MDEAGTALDGVTGETDGSLAVVTHAPELVLSRRRLARRSGGADLTLIARVSCLDFCDLRGTKVLMRSSSGEAWEEEIVAFNGAENETREIAVFVGPDVGAYSWTATYRDAGDDGRPAHSEVTSTVSFEYRPHAVSLATWGASLPAIVGQTVIVRIGAKCADGCCLGGAGFRVCDDGGREVAAGVLSEAPREGTDGLYGAEASFAASEELGVHRYTVVLDAFDGHNEARSTFAFLVIEEPSCKIDVTVTDEDAGDPIASARVSLHPFVETTGSDGRTVLPADIGKGTLRVVAKDYEDELLSLVVAGDTELHVALKRKPEDVGDF